MIGNTIKRYLFVTFSFLLIGFISTTEANNNNYTSTGNGYQLFCMGDCFNVYEPKTVGGLMMMGGGEDVDDAFKWLISNAANGDIVVLRASGTDAYNEYIYSLAKCNSVTTLIITSSEGSNAEEVVTFLKRAEAVFVSGGDQSKYIQYWKDSKMYEVLDFLIHKKVVSFGGTSAGLHIQGQYIFDGKRGSVVSSEALENPYHIFMTFEYDFLNFTLTKDIFTDSHFIERDRMGRLITFMSRMIEDGTTKPGTKSIGVSEGSALLVNTNGVGVMVGKGPIYLLKANSPPSVCRRQTPLTVYSIKVDKIDSSNAPNVTFSFNDWSDLGSGSIKYTLDVIEGKIYSTQLGGSIY